MTQRKVLKIMTKYIKPLFTHAADGLHLHQIELAYVGVLSKNKALGAYEVLEALGLDKDRDLPNAVIGGDTGFVSRAEEDKNQETEVEIPSDKADFHFSYLVIRGSAIPGLILRQKDLPNGVTLNGFAPASKSTLSEQPKAENFIPFGAQVKPLGLMEKTGRLLADGIKYRF